MDIQYNAKITVNSVIDNLTDAGLPDGDPEINIFTVDGIYNHLDDVTEMLYTEKNEDNITVCTLRIEKGDVALSRRGAVECRIMFSEGATCKTLYQVPPYSFDMSVSTLKIRNSLSATGGELQLIYNMNIGGQDKKVRMKINVRPK